MAKFWTAKIDQDPVRVQNLHIYDASPTDLVSDILRFVTPTRTLLIGFRSLTVALMNDFHKQIGLATSLHCESIIFETDRVSLDLFQRLKDLSFSGIQFKGKAKIIGTE
jgi:hypothetical protein